ncbi:MAG: chromosome condensation regulator [Hyperionvirus sp.]|uniref:Chromosome condensation regulator n=1 Tax=Hyperionvirus sp. TaxID=2487770 RepID=A0A3G5A8R2_9VIRU|nr:MAG: chromosome condensation regulator [Hyperionvirus sp.]
MDLLSRIKNLPTDLQYKITNYDPRTLFILPKIILSKYDWFKLIKMNFSLTYDKKTSTNEQIMKVYWENCISEKIKIVYGYRHIIIILSDGTLMGSGANACGQLGVGDYKSKNIFTEIRGIGKNIAEVVCGYAHTIIRLTDGRLLGCGDNLYGQLGLGNNDNRSQFVEIKNIPRNITKVTCGYYDTFIRLTDGTLMSCGINGYVNRDVGRFERNIFQTIEGIPKNIVEVQGGHSHVIVRLADGKLIASGNSLYAGLNIKEEHTGSKFLEIPGIPKNIAEVACGISYSIIRLTDGTLMGCGFNRFGSDKSLIRKFEEIKGIPKNIARVICKDRTILKLTNGTSIDWGINRLKPDSQVFTYGTAENIEEVICGYPHVIVSLKDGTLMRSISEKFEEVIERNEYRINEINFVRI